MKYLSNTCPAETKGEARPELGGFLVSTLETGPVRKLLCKDCDKIKAAQFRLSFLQIQSFINPFYAGNKSTNTMINSVNQDEMLQDVAARLDLHCKLRYKNNLIGKKYNVI